MHVGYSSGPTLRKRPGSARSLSLASRRPDLLGHPGTRAERKRRQPACKPGFVWPRTRYPGRGGHSSGTVVADRLKQPTRTTGLETGLRRSTERPCRPYSVLLPVGFAVPSALPRPRCALTAPFHPDPRNASGGGLLSVALSLGLPPPDVIRHRVSVEPGLSSPDRKVRSGRPAG